MKSRLGLRRRKIVAHRAEDFVDAERWDLEFWQQQSPAMRLSALVAIRKDIMKITGSRVKIGKVH